MKKVKFTDVAHLYIGCDMRHRWSAADDAQIIKLTADRLRYGTMDWIPMLIPADNITSEDKNELAIHLLDIHSNSDDSTIFKTMSTITFMLLSKGYDLFNLIENGEAIRKEVKNG